MSGDRPAVEMTPAQWAIVRSILDALVPAREVWAFGSRARHAAKPYSDLDLVVMGEEPLPLAARAALREAFSESDLPWRVDVVDWAATDAAFRQIIERDHVVLRWRD